MGSPAVAMGVTGLSASVSATVSFAATMRRNHAEISRDDVALTNCIALAPEREDQNRGQSQDDDTVDRYAVWPPTPYDLP